MIAKKKKESNVFRIIKRDVATVLIMLSNIGISVFLKQIRIIQTLYFLNCIYFIKVLNYHMAL